MTMPGSQPGQPATPGGPLLTIAIPTFNRNDLLRANLAVVLEQAAGPAQAGLVRVLIIDNASPVPASTTLGQLPGWVEVRRNAFNVGGNGNILRCFESCQTPWLWIIGDDDRPESGAVAAAIASIRQDPEAVAILHAVRHQVERSRSWRTEGIDAFMASLDAFGNLLFVPSTLYHVAALKPRFDLAYHYAYSCAPHLVLLLTSLAQRGGLVVFLNSSNIAFERPENENRGWIIPIARGLPTLLELPDLPPRARARLARHLGGFPSLASLIHQALLRQRFGEAGLWSELRQYVLAVHRLSFLDAPIRRLSALVLIPVLLVPWLSYPIVSWTYRRLTGHASGRNKMPVDRY